MGNGPAVELFVTANAGQAAAEFGRLKLAVTSVLTSIGAVAEFAAGAMVGMAGAIWIATSSVTDWQKGLVNAAAIGGLTKKQMWELGEASVDASVKMGIAAEEITSGYVTVTRAGFEDMNEIMELNRVIMMASIANNISYAESANVIINSVKAFKLSACSLAR